MNHPTLRSLATLVAGLGLAAVCLAADESASTDDQRQFASQVEQLVNQLNDDTAAERDAAAMQLIELAGSTALEADRLLAQLPAESEQMPLAIRERLATIRRQVQDRMAKAAVAATTVTLTADQQPLAEVFAAIEEQTGNKYLDRRERFGDGGGVARSKVSIELENEPYWSAVDQLLDAAGLGVYNYAGSEALAVVARSQGEAPRFGRAVYPGPFRIEVLSIQSQRSLRQPNLQSLKLQVEVAWEPRMRPIAVSQRASDLTATGADGQRLAVARNEAVLGTEVPAGTQAAELILSFNTPSREVTHLASVTGKLRALVPGRRAKIRFDNLARAAGTSQRVSGVEVIVDAVRRNNRIWEIHMRLRLDEGNNAFESQRGWVFQNLSYLEDAAGQTIDNAGLETTRQGPNEVGVAYFFDLPDGLDGLTWVYETPAAIVELPVEYELKDVPLP